MAGDDDHDSPSHAADEPTAMWGADELEGLGLDRAPSEPPPPRNASPKTPAGSESSVQVSLGAAEAPHQPVGKPRPEIRRPAVLPWILTVLGAVLLAVAAFYLVRTFR